MIRKKTFWTFFVLLIILAVVFIMANFAGGSRLGFKKVLACIFNPGASGMEGDIIWKIRLPRIILALFVGAGLSVCGAVFQGLLRNPLAGPYTLGVSGGAALGVTIGVVLSAAGLFLPFFALGGSLLSISIVYLIASNRRFSNTTLILSGVILNFLFSSLVFFIFSLSKSEDVHGIILWLMGDLSSAQPYLIKIVSFFIIPAVGVLLIFGRDLNILTLGEEKAMHLGVNAHQVRKILFIIASCIIGACVAASGIIGFVGLIIPHFVRRLISSDHRLLLPASCIVGASFLILCDVFARIIIRPLELPVGVITGIFGGIFFLCILIRSKKQEMF